MTTRSLPSLYHLADLPNQSTNVRFRGETRRYNVESAHLVRDADQ